MVEFWMNPRSQLVDRWIARGAALALFLASGACASKGATTLDEDAKQSAAAVSNDPVCGNGRIEKSDDEDVASEDCDGADLDGVTCENLGFEGGRLFCDPVTCLFATDGCIEPPVEPTGGTGG
jgi:hypothetical protein